MRKYLTLTLLVPFVLASCSIDWDDEKGKRIGELEKQVTEMKKEKENDLFKKKQECTKYKDTIQNEAKSEAKEWLVYYKYFSELFYSPTKQSCFAILEEKSKFSNQEYWIIQNILTWEITNYRKFDDGTLFYNELKKLKWE